MRARYVVVVCLTAASSAAVACSLLVDTTGLAGGADGPDGADGADGADGPDGADASLADALGDAATPVVDADAGRCPDAGTDPALVLYLPFDEAAGATAFDCSGRGHDGQVLGAGPTRTAGHSGSALVFDGTQTCVALGMPADLVLKGSFTVATWARVDEYVTPPPEYASRTILAKTTAPTTLGWRFVTLVNGATTEMGFKIGTSSDAGTFTVASPGPQPLSTWIHFAGIWVPGDHADLFINGVLVKRSTGIPPIVEDADASVFAGCVRGTQHFKGALDELRIYARALSQDEIAALAR